MPEETPTSPQSTGRRRTRRPPRAARARKLATALSVAATLALGGVMAWREGEGTVTTTAATAGTKQTSTATAAGTTSSTVSSTSSHTTTKGS